METFKLNNLRELSSEEQMRLNGGSNSPCDSYRCSCQCSCRTDEVAKSVGEKMQSSIDKVETSKELKRRVEILERERNRR